MTRPTLIVLLCALLAFAASLSVSRDVFERLPHLEDEFAYLYQARIFARGDTHVALQLPRRAYWQPFTVTMSGNRFGKYPPGWPLALATGVHSGAPWIVNAWLAMLTVALAYRLGREIFDRRTGAVAALLTATSPAALLLNATLMAHTASLFWTTLFLYGFWRLENRARRRLWGAIAGTALGLLLITRPMTAAGVAFPFMAVSAWRLVVHVHRRSRPNLLPLLMLAICALAVGLIWPAFNYTVSARQGESFPTYLWRFVRGDADTNLYLRIWPYDRAGFGEGHGRAEGGHTLSRGLRHTWRDLQCAARDLYGWAAPPGSLATPDDNACLATSPGLSWVLLPLGVLSGWRRRWTWLLLAVPAALVVVYVAYWLGAGLYSARYYFEGLTAAALLSAAGLTRGAAWLSRRWRGAPAWLPYLALATLTAYALAVYSPARLDPLRGYGNVSQARIDRVQDMRRQPDRPLVVIAWGEHHWRDVAALMALTGPYLDGDIVLARDPTGQTVEQILAQWKDREVIYFVDGAFRYVLPE